MTGMLRSGKTSVRMRSTAKTLPRVMATIATITVIGCRSAKSSASLRSFLARCRVRAPVALSDQKKPSGRNSAEGQESNGSYRKGELCR